MKHPEPVTRVKPPSTSLVRDQNGLPPKRHQRGVAVITALLLTTLAVTIVASLFWQQQVQVRSIENQRTQLQKQWILRGALDWARLILDESGKSSPTRDDLQQPWAVGLAETRLDSYVENGRADAGDATITGKIIDAQSYFNLAGLALAGVRKPKEIEAFGRLLTQLRIEPALAVVAADGIAASQQKDLPGATGASGAAIAPAAAASGQQAGLPIEQQGTAAQADPAVKMVPTANATGQMAIAQVEDLLALPGFTPEIVAKLKNFIIILPVPTKINVNTASAEVLTAVFNVPMSTAQAIVANRTIAAFKSEDDFKTTRAQLPPTAVAADFGVKTNYFIVDGRVKMSRAALEVLALINRPSATGPTTPGVSKVLWIHEN